MAGSLPTASPPVMTPGGTSAHMNFEVWEASADGALYQKQLFLPRISDFKRAYSKLHNRNLTRLSGNSMASTDVGTGLLYQNPIGAEVTLTPTHNYVATAWSEPEAAQSDYPFDSDLASEMEQALAEMNDQSGLANITTGTNFRGSNVTDVSAGLWRNAIALLQRITSGSVIAGQTTIYGILDVSQYGPAMSIEEFTHADIRGDDENPQVKGIWSKGGGAMLMLTTVCTSDTNGTHGAIWVPMAFGKSYNLRATPVRQRLELQNRLILHMNFGTTVRHDERFVGIRTQNTIPA